MIRKAHSPDQARTLDEFLEGKTPHTLLLFNHFVQEFKQVGNVTIQPAKTMIGIANDHKRIAYITQLGKNFIHVTFPFTKPHPDNLCFQKIAQVPGVEQYNHHFRMLALEDMNDEVRKFMKLAIDS